MKTRVDDGLGERRKKEKTGFKVDRSARYLEKHRKEREALTGKKIPKKKESSEPTRLRELKFDPEERKNYLLSLHKKKNERRVNAMVESRRRVAKENNRFRRESREEARRQYNEYAKVPILPDYTFRMPDPLAEQEAAEAQHDEEDEEDEEEESENEMGPSGLATDVAAVFDGQRLAPKQTGMSLYTGDAGAVTVDVQPLFGGQRNDGTVQKKASLSTGLKNKFAGGLDFSDLPSDVASKLKKLMDDHKGPAQKRQKVHVVKEMQKYHKIRKHSRKKTKK